MQNAPWNAIMRWFFEFNLIHSPDCEECHDLHYGECPAECPVHGALQIIEDKTVGESIKESAAMASTPPILTISDSSIPGAGLGVFSTTEIPKGVRFGPYKGIKIGWEHVTEDANTSYCWEVSRIHQ